MTASEVAKDHHSNPLMDKMKKIAQIKRVALSKMSDSWHNVKERYGGIISLTTKPAKPPVKHAAPIKTK